MFLLVCRTLWPRSSSHKRPEHREITFLLHRLHRCIFRYPALSVCLSCVWLRFTSSVKLHTRFSVASTSQIPLNRCSHKGQLCHFPLNTDAVFHFQKGFLEPAWFTCTFNSQFPKTKWPTLMWQVKAKQFSSWDHEYIKVFSWRK